MKYVQCFYTADVYSQFSKVHFTQFSNLIYQLFSIVDNRSNLLPTNLPMWPSDDVTPGIPDISYKYTNHIRKTEI